MPTMVIGLDFITGRCVSASPHDRDAPEWPPHPGRLFMALSATCFEMGEDPEEVAALKWLECLAPPEVYASEHHARSLVKYYVPVNDKLTVSKAILQTTPGLSRSKQERSFPTAIPLDPAVEFIWRDVDDAETHLKPLSLVCENVIRVGHSSSLVMAWADIRPDDALSGPDDGRICWRPTARTSHWQARVASPGEYERLRLACKADRIETFAQLKLEIELTAGKRQKEAKTEFEATFGEPFKSSLRAPEPTPPSIGLWQGYQASSEMEEAAGVKANEHFDSELLVLTKFEGRNLGVEDCLALTTRLRQAVIKQCPEAPPPEWLSGHSHNGEPTTLSHVAFLALPFVGREQADGHVMGLAMALPKRIPPEERGPALAPLLFDSNGEVREIELRLGSLGIWGLRLEDRPQPPQSLLSHNWTRPSAAWASVTPVVLDRFPKVSRNEDRLEWEMETRRIIEQSCSHAGFPTPVEIDIDTTSWHCGSPRAYRKSRRLHANSNERPEGWMGNGFPPMAGRPGKPSRPQIHVYLRFEFPITGPVLLGAGRFFGYGLFKPII